MGYLPGHGCVEVVETLDTGRSTTSGITTHHSRMLSSRGLAYTSGGGSLSISCASLVSWFDDQVREASSQLRTGSVYIRTHKRAKLREVLTRLMAALLAMVVP